MASVLLEAAAHAGVVQSVELRLGLRLRRRPAGPGSDSAVRVALAVVTGVVVEARVVVKAGEARRHRAVGRRLLQELLVVLRRRALAQRAAERVGLPMGGRRPLDVDVGLEDGYLEAVPDNEIGGTVGGVVDLWRVEALGWRARRGRPGSIDGRGLERMGEFEGGQAEMIHCAPPRLG